MSSLDGPDSDAKMPSDEDVAPQVRSPNQEANVPLEPTSESATYDDVDDDDDADADDDMPLSTITMSAAAAAESRTMGPIMHAPSSAADSFSCGVCYEAFDPTPTSPQYPRLLQCAHTFCSQCIGHLQRRDGHITCPSCRQKTATTQHRSPNPNYALIDLLSTLQIDSRLKRRAGPMCKDHDEPLKLFCRDDNIPICNHCRDFGDHTGHTIALHRTVADELRFDIQKLVDRSNQWSGFLRDEFRRVDTEVRAVSNCRKRISDALDFAINDIMVQLDQRKTALLDQVDSLVSLDYKVLSIHRTKVTEALACASRIAKRGLKMASSDDHTVASCGPALRDKFRAAQDIDWEPLQQPPRTDRVDIILGTELVEAASTWGKLTTRRSRRRRRGAQRGARARARSQSFRPHISDRRDEDPPAAVMALLDGEGMGPLQYGRLRRSLSGNVALERRATVHPLVHSPVTGMKTAVDSKCHVEAVAEGRAAVGEATAPIVEHKNENE